MDAVYREEVVSTAVGELWNGTKLRRGENEQGRLTWTPVIDATGNRVQATRDEWVEQYMDMYTSDKGMGVVVGRDLVEQVADALSDEHGMMYNLERSEWENLPETKQPLAMDRLAYGGTLDDLRSLAGQGANLFSGAHMDFAPRTIRENQRAIEADAQAASLKPIDTKQTRVQKARAQQAQRVETVQESIAYDDAAQQLAHEDAEFERDPQAQLVTTGQLSMNKQGGFDMEF